MYRKCVVPVIKKPTSRDNDMNALHQKIENVLITFPIPIVIATPKICAEALRSPDVVP
jgi:hypothetical protein